MASLLERLKGWRNQSVDADRVVDELGGAGTAPGHPERADTNAIASVGACTRLYERCFAAATVSPAESRAGALRAPGLGLVGRAIALRGESVWLLNVSGGELQILPVAFWDIRGNSPDPATWVYNLDLHGPSGGYRRTVSGESVLHFRVGANPATPWHGQSPLAESRHTAALAATLEERMAQEASIPNGQLFFLPGHLTADQKKRATENFTKRLGGKLVVMDAPNLAGAGNLPTHFTEQHRVGADFPLGNIELRRDVSASILAAYGVPQNLLFAGSGSDAREGYRRFLRATLLPIGNVIAEEIRAKVDPAATLNFQALRAGDIATAARAFKQFRDGDVDLDRALELAGLMD